LRAVSRLRDSGIAVRALCVLAVLSGCVSVPLPESPGSAWRPPEGVQARDPVWAGIRARQPDLAGPLALPDLMRIALENNPAGRKAWNEARAAAAQVRQAQGLFTPTLSGTLSGSRQSTEADPDSFDQQFLKYGPGLQLNYLVLNLGGGRRAAVEQAVQSVHAADQP
jgi:outer membrane protein TolC